MTQVLIYMYIPSQDPKIRILVNTEKPVLLVTHVAIYMYTPAQDPSRPCCVSVCAYVHICAYVRLCAYVRICLSASASLHTCGCAIYMYISALCIAQIEYTLHVLYFTDIKHESEILHIYETCYTYRIHVTRFLLPICNT